MDCMTFINRVSWRRHGKSCLASERAPLARVAAATLAAMLWSTVVVQSAFAAENFPTRPVRIVVPFPAGGGTDSIARVLAKSFTTDTGQPFVVENRAGASGNIGLDAIAKSQADGYTIGLTTSNLTMNGALYKRLAFDPQRDFQPVSLIASSPLVIGVSNTLGISALSALRAKAKASGQPLAYSSCGNGTPQHFAGAMLAAAWNVRFVHVPYKGCAPALVDALGGQVPIFISTVANALPYSRDPRIGVLAVTGHDRSRYIPAVPSASEQGVTSLDMRVWFGLIAPNGLPEPVLKRLVALTLAAMKKPEVRQILEAQGYDAVGSDPATFAATIATEIPFWKQLAAKYAISLE